MTQEQKELLLKDLCARLPYGVKAKKYTERMDGEFVQLAKKEIVTAKDIIVRDECPGYTIKPYLFPLSSMTEEQRKEISKRYNYHSSHGLCIKITNHSEGYWDEDLSCHLQDYLWLLDWLNKNHFDYRGLIEKGLSIDATGLNIY